MESGTVLAILGLGTLGWAVPVLLMQFLPDSLRGLLAALLVAVPALTLAGSALFVALYTGEAGLGGLLAAGPGAAVHFWNLGVRAALIWGPVLALTALSLAHGIERRRGERMAARDRD